MRRYLSRRDFMKLAGLGLGAMAFNPISAYQIDYRWNVFSQPKRLPPFPGSAIIGRVTDPDVPLRNRPTDATESNLISKVGADTLVEWNR
ncbi:MAG: twin-arginine translocation signal domain-containing protein, partial [Anaerolineales bacterium]|nr:twin-arginine translocation signal domain-containing protein [Anaerolineales bacterium]